MTKGYVMGNISQRINLSGKGDRVNKTPHTHAVREGFQQIIDRQEIRAREQIALLRELKRVFYLAPCYKNS